MPNSDGVRTTFHCLLWLLVLSLLAGFSWHWPGGHKSWADVDNFISSRYPEVNHISTEDLQSLYKSGRQFYLFDIRTPEEFEVSHLAGAVRLEKVEEVNLPGDAFIIAYCAVGVRSAAFVDDLQRRGYSHVYNLKGSIFGWANKGYPTVRKGRNAYKVHPYNSRWGVLLDKELHND
ncbi:MAG: rhodanese-like domain-containing protein [Deltaproteobacteria bacterium]|nr:rhodanese-like domain-containing protein [Deltaproteobacteria bacterium]